MVSSLFFLNPRARITPARKMFFGSEIAFAPGKDPTRAEFAIFFRNVSQSRRRERWWRAHPKLRLGQMKKKYLGMCVGIVDIAIVK